MDELTVSKIVGSSRPSFFGHVFSTTEESKAEIMNIAQYALMAIIPIVVLNKTIQRFVPDADNEASSIEILAEVVIQILIIFIGLVIIHRIISYFPTYSGYKYEPFILTNAILTFLVIVLSLQTKLGLKVNMLYERVINLWTGNNNTDISKPKYVRDGNKYNNVGAHVPSQADMIDNNPSGIFPPQPINTSSSRASSTGANSNEKTNGILDNMFSGNPSTTSAYPTSDFMSYGPIAANGLLGSSF